MEEHHSGGTHRLASAVLLRRAREHCGSEIDDILCAKMGDVAWVILIISAFLVETWPAAAEPVAPAGMVFIRGGDLPMGSEESEVEKAWAWCREFNPGCRKDSFLLELPPREATVASFFLDRTEVTNADFGPWLARLEGARVEARRFVRLHGKLLADLHPSGSGLQAAEHGLQIRPEHARRPATQLSVHAAEMYCRAQGKRLPREAEWELAARGTEARMFPWGEERPGCEDAVFARMPGGACARLSGPQDVGQARRDRTPDGAADLAGNVAEWTADRLGERFIVRGGDFGRSAPYLRTTTRNALDASVVHANVGFRCARSLSEDRVR